MTIGVPGKPAPPHSGQPFNRCTHVAVDPKTGDLYVSDGYSNSSVHKYSPDGKLLFSWGSPGTDPGEFNVPHNIVTDKDGYVYVADRENHRVQIFDANGRYETQWNNLHRPCALFASRDNHVYIGELGWGMTVNKEVPNIGPRISVMTTGGDRVARIGHLGVGLEVGQFMAPHGIFVDSRENIYVGEVAWTQMRVMRQEPSESVRSLQKLVKVASTPPRQRSGGHFSLPVRESRASPNRLGPTVRTFPAGASLLGYPWLVVHSKRQRAGGAHR
jgi:hypothetical protein